MSGDSKPARRLRSQDWFDNPDHLDLTALYLERFMNYGTTPEELRSGKPIIGIAQSGSDLNPCNRHHMDLAKRVRDGIRDAGGIPIEFPTHPLFENCKRPTAALDRNLAYLGLVEILYGYPLDGVVLTTGCDKTTPSALMAASTVDIPAIVLSGGPMLDGWHDGELVGSGTVIWRSRRKYGAGEITREQFLEAALSSAPSIGHCNTMGTALTMNSMAEALGMSLTGCAAIPAAYRERGQMAYRTGRRAVELVLEDMRPSKILTREAFLNAVRVNSALGGSTNAQPHLMAMAKHAGVDLRPEDWQLHGYDIPLLANVQPAGAYLGERFHRAGGVPAIMWELMQAGKLDTGCLTVTGRSMGENLEGCEVTDREVIRPYGAPMKERAGFLVL
ncbi:MAG: dihydroxy-acid dehydratase, partial [Polymorphum sp.]|nr:dihydroxy-acid dehydratase [Polymorphum sp.]